LSAAGDRPGDRPGEPLGEVLANLERAGFDAAEVYWKTGRSRHYGISGGGISGRGLARGELSGGDRVVLSNEEAGWAMRAGAGMDSFFLAATGAPRTDLPWPEPEAGALSLPEPVTVRPAEEGASPRRRDLEAPLLAEREGLALLDALARELAAELPGSALLSARLDDGASESHLRSSRGVEASWRNRLAALELQAVGPDGALASLAAAAPEARQMAPAALARRLVDRLTVAAGRGPDRDRGEFLLAPVVGARILAGLLPLVVGPEAPRLARALEDRAGRLASEALTVVDDGRHPGGPLAAPFDGEGIPTRRLTLVEAGRFRRPLLARAEGSPGAGTGAMRRPSWREPPVPGPSHLYVMPNGEVSVASLLRGIARGYYLIDAPGPGHFDPVGDFFSLPVAGFAITDGKALYPVARARLTGAVTALLRGLKAQARDLAFLPLQGLLGAPTLLITGIEITPENG